MRQIGNNEELAQYIKWCSDHHKSVGFVPTMGALHLGHLSLVDIAANENDIVIVSIFVNPTQFNNAKDLEKYPRTLDKDAKLLTQTECNVIYTPSVSDVYPTSFIPRNADLGILDTTLEGHYRPGHYVGVVSVVQRLFDLVQPQKAYFGRKDLQQVAVIKTMVKQFNYPIEIKVGETVREESGLAMSSRNSLLTTTEKKEAVAISELLFEMREWSKVLDPLACETKAIKKFEETTMQLEYLSIIHPLTFENLIDEWVPGATVCIVAYCGEVRLIDNLELVPLT